jgi:hypothetical membrane protein
MAGQVMPGSTHLRPSVREASPIDLRPPGILLFSLATAFLVVTMLAASIAPGYDFHAAAISDLGVTPETALLFNGLLVLIGLANIGAGFLLYARGRHRWLLATYLLAGIGAVGAGLFPLSTGGLHSIFALLAFVCINLEVIGSALLLPGPTRILGLVAGGVGLIYTVLMVIGDAGDPAVFGPIGHGGSERMIAYPAMLWLLAFGGYLLARATPDEEPGGRLQR